MHIYAYYKLFFTYKLSTISNILGTLLQMILLVLFWIKIYDADIYTIKYVVYSRIVYALIGDSNIWDLAEDIRNGNIVIKLVKPISFFKYNLVMHISSKLIVFIVQCMPFFVMAFVFIPIEINLFRVIFSCFSIILSVIICYCFDFIISFLCVFTNSIWGISAFRDGFIQIFSGALIPIYLMPQFLYSFVHYLPFIYMVDMPVRILISDYNFWGGIRIQILYSILMISLCLVINKIYNNKLQIQGG